MASQTCKRTLLSVSVLVAMATSTAAQATNGYFAHGFGTKSKGMGGVGMAISRDSFAPATNPAGIAGMESRVDGALAYFRPERSYRVEGEGLSPADLGLEDLDIDLTETVEETLGELAEQLGTSVESLLDPDSGSVTGLVDDLSDLLQDGGDIGASGIMDGLQDVLSDRLDSGLLGGVGLDAATIGDSLFMSLLSDTLVPLNTNQERIDSRDENHFIPSFGFVRQLSDRSSWGVTVVGNGGMNTNYPGFENIEGCQGPFGSAIGSQSGPFCEGSAGVDLMQLMVMPTFATSFGEEGGLRAGVSPILSYQRFQAWGLGQFSGISESPEHVSDNGWEDSFGYGVRVGLQADVGQRLTLGASYQSRQRHDGFDDYRGLFAEQGKFDIPSTWGAGVAFRVTRQLTVAADYTRINYSEVDSISNSVAHLTEDGQKLGSASGPGFGWKDIEVYKIGLEYDTRGPWEFRAGYNYGDNPITSEEVTFNILAPGVMREHYTIGATREIGEQMELSFAAMYAPRESVRGDNAFFPDQDVEIEMRQYEFEVGLGYRF